MRVGHLVCADGVSGDMLLGALVDAGAPLDALRSAVAALGIGEVELAAEAVRVHGVAATRVTMRVAADVPRLETLDAVRRAIEGSSLEPAVAGMAISAFERLAGAEARAHATDAAAVTFHELGDPDTIVDVVGACAGLHALEVERWTCGPVAVGGGRVDTDHGSVTVPAPAVADLLAGFVVEGGGRRRELATPTGAAVLACFAEPVDELPAVRLDGVGRGASADAQSVLTVLTGTGAGVDTPDRGAAVIETTVDDLSPEFVPAVLDRLRQAGAHDAWAVPVLMKKGRPGYELKVLADEADVARLATVLFEQTPTLGLRTYRVVKRELARRFVDVDVEGQQVAVKVAELDGRTVNVAPEFDDVALAAEKLGRPLDEVRHTAVEAVRRQLAGPGEGEAPRGSAEQGG